MGGGWAERWVSVVEDVKASCTRTREYILKRKPMKERFGIEFQEVDNVITYNRYVIAAKLYPRKLLRPLLGPFLARGA